VKVDGSETTKEAFARPKYKEIIAGVRHENRGKEKNAGFARRLELVHVGESGVI
jgi:hypothetical protein